MSEVRWQYILCYTPNPLDPTGDLVEICEIESARSRKVEIVRNRAGTMACDVSVYDPAVPYILDNIPLGDIRGSVRKSLLVRRNKVDILSGPISAISGSLQDGQSSLSLTAVGWIEYLFHRKLSANKHYDNLPAHEIIFDLLSLANIQDPTYPIPIFPGTFTDGTVPTTLFSPTFNKGDTYGESIQKMSDVENGVDFDVNPRTRELNVYAWDTYTVRNNIKLGYRWGAENIQSVNWNESGIGGMSNRIIGTGNNNIPYGAEDVDSLEVYGVFDDAINFPVETSANIPAYINAELVVKSRPLVTYTISPKPVGMVPVDPTPHPKLFEDFFIGDQISFTAKEGFIEIKNQGIRVFGAGISISDDGVETIDNLQTSPAT